MDAIEVHGLTRDYNGLRAMDRLQFSVAAGEIFGLLGPNGAGKTTTIKVLTGQLRPTSGQAFVMGCDVVHERQRLKPEIGVVFDHPNLYDGMTGRENLLFFARLYRVNRSRMEAVLDRVGMSEHAGRKVKTYSNGMKQRILIARALLHAPRVLFLDEPTRGLDPHVARELRIIVTDLAGQGMTVFLTTHYMEEADRLSRRVAIIERGKIVALDTPGNLKSACGVSTLEDVFLSLTGRYWEPGRLSL
jgi:ABC-2 type transport system ATP-binding protein